MKSAANATLIFKNFNEGQIFQTLRPKFQHFSYHFGTDPVVLNSYIVNFALHGRCGKVSRKVRENSKNYFAVKAAAQNLIVTSQLIMFESLKNLKHRN